MNKIKQLSNILPASKLIEKIGYNPPCKILVFLVFGFNVVVLVVVEVEVVGDTSEACPPLHTNLHWNPKRLGKVNSLFSVLSFCDLNIKAKGLAPPTTMLTFSYFFGKYKVSGWVMAKSLRNEKETKLV